MTLSGPAARLIVILAVVLALTRPEALAQQAYTNPFWTRVPAVTVVAVAANDPRLPLVRDAVEFWNRTFADIGSAFRLGPVTVVGGMVPVDELLALSKTVVDRGGLVLLPDSVTAQPGDLIVALSDGDFVSFCARSVSGNKALVAIKAAHAYPLTLPKRRPQPNRPRTWSCHRPPS